MTRDLDINGEFNSSAAAREAYSRDASIFQVHPLGVAYPRDVSDLAAIVTYANAHNADGGAVSIAPRAGGTCMSGGSLTEGIVIDMTRYFTDIQAVDPHNKTITVQTGVMHRDIEKAAAEHGLLFAPYTSSKDLCGIGGMIGNNASGELSLVHGPTSSNIESLTMLLSDSNEYTFGPLTPDELQHKLHLDTFEGTVYRGVHTLLESNRELIALRTPKVSKNAAGYALWDIWDDRQHTFNLGRLFVGSQATLGIATQATLKLIDKSPYKQMIVCAIDSIHQLTNVVRTIVQSGASICETFDHHTYELAQSVHPQDAARAHFANGKHMIVYGIFQGDSQERVDILANSAKSILEKGLSTSVAWIDDEPTQNSYQAIRRYSFKMLMDMNSDTQRAMPFIEDTIVPLEHYGEFISAIEAILEDYDMTYTYAGHIGEGSIRLIPLVRRSPAAPDDILDLETRVNDLVLAFRGSISVDHNDGIIRTPYLEQQYGSEMIGLFRQIKDLFDPNDIFNHGKKVGGSLAYARDHIDI